MALRGAGERYRGSERSVRFEPFHDIGFGPLWKGAFESPSPRNLYPDLAHVRLFKEDFLGGAQLVQRMTLS